MDLRSDDQRPERRRLKAPAAPPPAAEQTKPSDKTAAPRRALSRPREAALVLAGVLLSRVVVHLVGRRPRPRAVSRAAEETKPSEEPPAPRRLLSWRRGAALVVVGFVLSRLAVHLAGVRFDPGPLDYAGQVLGAGMLREDLLEAITHLHVQPPMFNLFIGLVLRAPRSWETPLFQGAYLAIGVGMALCLYAVLRRVGVGPKTSVGLSLLFMVSPSIILFENWLLYDYPVAALLCLAVLALLRYESGHHLRDAALFLAVLAVLVLTRSLFHLLWFLVWAAVLVAHRRRADWKKVTAVAGIALFPILAVHLNNLRVAGSFTTSSSLGVSLAKITTFQLPEAERRALVAAGELSPLALVDPLSPLVRYRGLVPRRPTTGVAVLDADVKGQYGDPPTSHGMDPNLNSSTYLDISNRYLDDAMRTVRQRPGAYVQGLVTAFDLYFRPGGDVLYYTENRERLAWLNTSHNVVVSGVFSDEGVVRGFPQARRQYRGGPGRTAWFAIAQYAVAVVGGAWVLWRGRRRGTYGIPRLSLAFLWSTVVYVTVVSNAVEVGENARFRLYAEPLVLVLLAALIAAWWRAKSGSDAVADVRSVSGSARRRRPPAPVGT